jgi:hypothetical protein
MCFCSSSLCSASPPFIPNSWHAYFLSEYSIETPTREDDVWKSILCIEWETEEWELGEEKICINELQCSWRERKIKGIRNHFFPLLLTRSVNPFILMTLPSQILVPIIVRRVRGSFWNELTCAHLLRSIDKGLLWRNMNYNSLKSLNVNVRSLKIVQYLTHLFHFSKNDNHLKYKTLPHFLCKTFLQFYILCLSFPQMNFMLPVFSSKG